MLNGYVALTISSSVFANGSSAGGGSGPAINSQSLAQHFNGQPGPQQTALSGHIIHWTADENGQPIASQSLPACYRLTASERTAQNCYYAHPSQGGSGG
ncbi:hypothetical protein [Pelagibaculum spongiae]|uniref:Uncharacterized protein n=1 Tax=Pelagibaculum spongiae TaxID=2080658 RepID=A0A2V1GUD5_9GAMM|nr:hypothetical protein [Pelagibaculum spongiae]PVZ68267.1 hypothetical protein DC094_13325 [Pelagibaculum spongiae]